MKLAATYQNILELEDKINKLLPTNSINKKPASDLLKFLQQWSDSIWSLSKQYQPFYLSNEMIHHGITMIQHPVFICGVHRSGTTLLRDLLDDHPTLSVLPAEGSFFTNLAPQLARLTDEEKEKFIGKEWLRRLVNPINQPPYWILGKSETDSSPYVEFARIFQAWYKFLKKEFPGISIKPHLAIILAYSYCINNSKGYLNKQLWVDKTPVQEKFQSILLSELPKSKFIHIVRNPVDIYLSRIAMEPSLNMYNFLKDLQISFRIASGFNKLKKDNYLIIKYEDLCSNPQSCMELVCHFLNIEFSERLMQTTVAGILSGSNSSFNNTSAPGVIIKSSLDRKRKITDKEIKMLSAFVYNYANDLGYSLPRVSKLLSLFTRFALFLKRSLANRRQMC